MKYFDATPAILKWASEELVVPYVSPLDGRIHRYFVDFAIEVKSGTGVKRFAIEVKPKSQCSAPQQPKRKTHKAQQRFISEAATYAVNQAKWQAAEEFCRQQGWKFLVLTEEHLFKNFQ